MDGQKSCLYLLMSLFPASLICTFSSVQTNDSLTMLLTAHKHSKGPSPTAESVNWTLLMFWWFRSPSSLSLVSASFVPYCFCDFTYAIPFLRGLTSTWHLVGGLKPSSGVVSAGNVHQISIKASLNQGLTAHCSTLISVLSCSTLAFNGPGSLLPVYMLCSAQFNDCSLISIAWMNEWMNKWCHYILLMRNKHPTLNLFFVSIVNEHLLWCILTLYWDIIIIV